MDITGKTITKVTLMKKPEYDDTGWLKIDFTDGTHCVICAGYDTYTGESENEYPTRIGISGDDNELIPFEQNG